MSLKTAVAIATLCSILVGASIGYLGATVNADSLLDTKIDRAIRPVERRIDDIATDVREIRKLLSEAILEAQNDQRYNSRPR